MRSLIVVLLLTLMAFAEEPRSRLLWNELLQQGKVTLSSHSKDTARIQRIGQRLVTASQRRVKWDFYLVHDDDPNAFTLGEGVIVVTEGLLAIGLDDDELAGVLAHEVAHGTEQHLESKDMRNEQRVALLKEALTLKFALDKAEAQMARYSPGSAAHERAREAYERLAWRTQQRMSDLEKRAEFLDGEARFQRTFNHEQEIDADVIGIRYAQAAGYKADGLSRALDKLHANAVKSFGRPVSGEGFTHPSLERRQQVLQKVMTTVK